MSLWSYIENIHYRVSNDATISHFRILQTQKNRVEAERTNLQFPLCKQRKMLICPLNLDWFCSYTMRKWPIPVAKVDLISIQRTEKLVTFQSTQSDNDFIGAPAIEELPTNNHHELSMIMPASSGKCTTSSVCCIGLLQFTCLRWGYRTKCIWRVEFQNILAT